MGFMEGPLAFLSFFLSLRDNDRERDWHRGSYTCAELRSYLYNTLLWESKALLGSGFLLDHQPHFKYHYIVAYYPKL